MLGIRVRVRIKVDTNIKHFLLDTYLYYRIISIQLVKIFAPVAGEQTDSESSEGHNNSRLCVLQEETRKTDRTRRDLFFLHRFQTQTTSVALNRCNNQDFINQTYTAHQTDNTGEAAELLFC